MVSDRWMDGIKNKKQDFFLKNKVIITNSLIRYEIN